MASDLVLIASQDTETVMALELSSGRERWSKNISEMSGNPRVVASGNTLLLDSIRGRTTVVDLQSGADRTLPATTGCVDNGRLIHVEHTAEGLSVVASNLGDQGHRVVADVPLPDAWKGGRVAACTRYGDRFVFFFTKEYLGGELAVIDATEPTARGSFYSLGVGAFWSSESILGTALSASSVLPRFTVLNEKDELVVVDVQERRIVRRTKAVGARAFRREDATFVTRNYPDLRIARIDGASGALTAAVCSDDNVELPSSSHIQGDEFWLHAGSWTDTVRLSVLNATTLKPNGANPLRVKDCLVETATLWGL